MSVVKPIPDNYPQLMPYLMVVGGEAAIKFYTEIFGGTERMRIPGAGGAIGHAEIQIGSAVIMLADEGPYTMSKGPLTYGGSPVGLLLYVDSVDTVIERALAAGAVLMRPAADQFYGDRMGVIKDPFGHVWSLATHIEDVTPEEMGRRAAAAAGGS